MFELLDEYTVLADGSGITPTTADQALVTLAIPERQGVKYYLCHFDIEIEKVTTPVAQTLDIEILNEAVVVKTFNYFPTTDVETVPYSITHPVAKNTSGTITLRLGNANAADVDTTFTVKNVWVAAVG